MHSATRISMIHILNPLIIVMRCSKICGTIFKPILFYKDQTTIFIATDHGRGDGEDWTHHNSKTPGSDQIWFAVMGPYT